MAHQWPCESKFEKISLRVLVDKCWACGGPTEVKDYKRRPVHLLEGPRKIVSQMTWCPTPSCEGHHQLNVAEGETLIAPPRWTIGWDVFACIGQRRFAHHQRVASIREDLEDLYGINLSEDAIEDYIGRYQAILAARQRDFNRLRKDYEGIKDLILSVDGLQPEMGHDTLYTVRELNAKRVWFAVPLRSSGSEELLFNIFLEAAEWATRLGLPVRAWISDKQGGFLTGIHLAFPGVPHRYCQNHFLRDVAKPVLELDSEAKRELRHNVRGIRPIEREVLGDKLPLEGKQKKSPAEVRELEECNVVLDYCAGVRGVLNKSRGGPLDPPGFRMAAHLEQVSRSIQKSLNKGVSRRTRSYLGRITAHIDRGLKLKQVEDALGKIPGYVGDLQRIYDTLDPHKGRNKTRQARFAKLREELALSGEPIRVEMARVMKVFEPGLFVGGDELDFLRDNLDLERWFRLPKSHERHVHGRQHAGGRLVAEGPSLALALDAHDKHPQQFTKEELEPYLGAMPTLEEQESIELRKTMHRAASDRTIGAFLKDLESRAAGKKPSRTRSKSRPHAPGG